MRLTIDKPGLAKALAHVASVVERRNTIPILSNVLVAAARNELKLTATDLDMELVETVPVRTKGEGATTVPAHMFYDIVRKLPEGADIELARDGEQGRLAITSGPAQFSLQTLPADDFPALSVDDLAGVVHVACRLDACDLGHEVGAAEVAGEPDVAEGGADLRLVAGDADVAGQGEG
jgi:DNA polymerase-3 subunit beta